MEVLVAVGRRNGMVQLLHIPLHCDHDTCSISISFRKQIRISNPYIKLAALRMLGPAVHTSAFVSNAAPDTCVIASHGSSGHFSLWQLLHNPCSSYARCFLCPSSSSEKYGCILPALSPATRRQQQQKATTARSLQASRRDLAVSLPWLLCGSKVKRVGR